ncbi:MAG: 4Fe-4S dicluster domain-containing protein [Oceanococcus sp.]|nr:MAG: 4Fe-4S dicluster domain-containing protein [Oceanococcus sp.]
MNHRFPIEQADLCVKCGLCAPHCPTYALSGMEPESPRGRIAMMTAIADGTVAPSDRAREHLDHCLSCQACEAVCPAKVPYLSLLDSHRALHPPRAPRTQRWLQSILSGQRLRGLLRATLRLAQRLRSWLWPISRALRLTALRRQLSLLPQGRTAALPAFARNAEVYIFAGCVGDLANAPAVKALLSCCRALKLKASVIPAGHCCGALAQHAGLPEQAETRRARLSDLLDPSKPVLALDSACANQLRDSGWSQVEEACHFLNRQHWPDQALRAPEQRVLIHQPCSQRNGLRQPKAARSLLQRVTGLELHDMPDTSCCGAAGTHMLQFEQRADTLRESKLAACQAIKPTTLVTTNIGCAMHLAAGLRLHDDAPLTTVCHPVELIAPCLESV